MESCWYHKILWETAPSEVRNVVFEKEVIFHEFDFRDPNSSISTLWWEFHSYLAPSMTNWAQIFTGLLFCAYSEIHQVGWSLTITNSVQCLNAFLFLFTTGGWFFPDPRGSEQAPVSRSVPQKVQTQAQQVSEVKDIWLVITIANTNLVRSRFW